MKKGLVVCALVFVLCFGFVSSVSDEILMVEEDLSSENPVCKDFVNVSVKNSEGQIIREYSKNMCNIEPACKGALEGSAFFCDYYTFGLESIKKEFCWTRDLIYSYLSTECLDNLVNAVQRRNGSMITIEPKKEGQQVCGNGICEGVETENICKLDEFQLLIDKYGVPEGQTKEEFLLSYGCQLACYEDCGSIIKNSDLTKPDEMIEIPYLESNPHNIRLDIGECTKPTPLIKGGIWNNAQGKFCLVGVSNEGATLTYKGKTIFVEYYTLYNYEVDVIEGEDQYLYLTFDSLFGIHKPGNRLGLFFKQFFI